MDLLRCLNMSVPECQKKIYFFKKLTQQLCGKKKEGRSTNKLYCYKIQISTNVSGVEAFLIAALLSDENMQVQQLDRV